MHEPPRTVEWMPDRPGTLRPGRVRWIDQTRLPGERVHAETRDPRVLREAIRRLEVRGAPAIGVAAALGLAAAAQDAPARTGGELADAVARDGDLLATARPTAVNLAWAVERMKRFARAHAAEPVERLRDRLIGEAIAIGEEDAAMCRAIGRHGLALLPDGATVLTHCNAGSLATARYGTALAPVYAAAAAGRPVRVFADETRPLLQGARLTAWELMQAGIDVTLICDHTAAVLMRQRRIDLVLVGADRIAANGDTANKIGTYNVAVLARAHRIPFYVLAPTSTFDLALATGEGIPIEERDPAEVTEGFGRRTAPAGVKVFSPAFDVTPADLVAAIVCEKGILRPPYGPALRGALGA